MTKESLIKIRKSLGVSQVVFAEMLGYSSAVRINEFEKGTRPITKQLEMTCHYLRLLVIKGLEYKTSKAFMQMQEIKDNYQELENSRAYWSSVSEGDSVIVEEEIKFSELIRDIALDIG
jgi:transcriptional regulator with XRE-family HTH domain